MSLSTLFGLAGDVPMHALTLRFYAKELEKSYQAQLHEQSLPLFRLTLFVAICAISVFYPADKIIFPDDYALMWDLRTFVMLPSVALALLFSTLASFDRYRKLFGWFAVSASGFSMAFGIFWYGKVGLMYFTFGTTIVAMFSLVLIGLPIMFATVTTWTFVLAATAAIVHSSSQPILTFAASNLLLVSCLILTIAAYRTENLSRRLYYKSMQLVEEQERIRAAKEQRSVWLENMAAFFRHEMKTCIRGLQTSLDLLTQRSAESLPIGPYVERARRCSETIDAIARGVATATSIESAIHREERISFELAPLVEEQVEVYRENYQDCCFIYQCDQRLLPVFGQVELIVLLLNNLVANALDYHVQGTPITIALGRRRACAVLEVTNKGPLLPVNRRELFDLFRSFRNAESPEEHHGIGLYVVKLIAEGFGGRVEAEDLTDKTGVVFQVAIPFAAVRGVDSGTAQVIQR